jgi:flagellar hook-length control protein FliK
VQTSGLFYESHLAQLAAGKATPQALRQEPQGRIPPQPPSPPGGAAQNAQQTAPSHGAPAASGGGASPETTQPHAPVGQTHTAPVPGIDPQAQLLVRQQLEVLANQAFIWQGEAWPGADMQWEVHRRPPDDEEDRDFQEDHWSTRLNLHLPTLGDVHARLSLSGDQLVMRLTAPQSAEQLGQAIEPLRARLLAQGLQASQLSVLAKDDDSDSNLPDPRENEIAAP